MEREVNTCGLIDTLTLSKSELMQRIKWSEGFTRSGQGKPAAAKNCIIYNRQHSSQQHPQENKNKHQENQNPHTYAPMVVTADIKIKK